jgi:hypothetical protein
VKMHDSQYVFSGDVLHLIQLSGKFQCRCREPRTSGRVYDVLVVAIILGYVDATLRLTAP